MRQRTQQLREFRITVFAFVESLPKLALQQLLERRALQALQAGLRQKPGKDLLKPPTLRRCHNWSCDTRIGIRTLERRILHEAVAQAREVLADRDIGSNTNDPLAVPPQGLEDVDEIAVTRNNHKSLDMRQRPQRLDRIHRKLHIHRILVAATQA
jgi:hypothetical protein